MKRGYRAFQVLEGLNDNSYKVDFSLEYQVQNTFNVCHLSQFPTFEEEDTELEDEFFSRKRG